MLGALALCQLVSPNTIFTLLVLHYTSNVWKFDANYCVCLQCLRHIMHIWQPSGLGFTWSRIPLTVGPWQVVPVALHRVDAIPGRLGMLLSGPSPPWRKTWSVSCFTVKVAVVTVYTIMQTWSNSTEFGRVKYLHCIGGAGRTQPCKLSLLCRVKLCNHLPICGRIWTSLYYEIIFSLEKTSAC